MIETVAEALHEANYVQMLSSCRRDPVAADQWMIAVLVPSKVVDAQTVDAGAEWFDVDIAIWNARTRRIIAQRRETRAILSDASELRATSIDSARYVLARGVRAFGVRDIHYPRCMGCQWSQTFLTLYVQRGDRIDRLLSTQVEEINDGPDSAECSAATHVIRTTLKVGDHASRRLADLFLITRAADYDANSKACTRPTIETRTTRYDGSGYGTIEFDAYRAK